MTFKTPPIAFSEDNFCAIVRASDPNATNIKTETRRLSNGSDKPRYSVGDRCYLTEPTQIDTIFAHVADTDHFWHTTGKVSHKITENDLIKITENDLIKIKSRKGGMYKKTIARFMLKSFARYWIEITDVKVERLNDITDEGAIAEGVKSKIQDEGSGFEVTYYWDYIENRFCFTCPRRSYLSEIEMLHGKEIAQSNPWVWVYKFKFCP